MLPLIMLQHPHRLRLAIWRFSLRCFLLFRLPQSLPNQMRLQMRWRKRYRDRDLAFEGSGRAEFFPSPSIPPPWIRRVLVLLLRRRWCLELRSPSHKKYRLFHHTHTPMFASLSNFKSTETRNIRLTAKPKIKMRRLLPCT